MSYSVIPIPGGSTKYDDEPVVQILSKSNRPMELSIKYNAAEITEGRSCIHGKILFLGVLEYRWRDESVDYEDFPEHQEDFEFGLIEIHKSAYIENMAIKGVRAQFDGHRFGEGIKDAEVRHFRMNFDDYGQFDIIALNVLISEVHV